MNESGKNPELTTVNTSTSANFDLHISQTIPAEHLRAMRDAYTYMIAAIDAALAAREQQAKRSAQIQRLTATKRRQYDARCVRLARAVAAGETLAAARDRLGLDKSLAPQMLKRGRALIRDAKSRAKKRQIIRLHLAGLGPAAIARIVAKEKGRCSAPYVCKVVAEYRNAAQVRLPYPPDLSLVSK